MTWLVSIGLRIAGWLSGSTVGRYVLAGLVTTAIVLFALARAFTAGKTAERNRQAAKSLKTLRSRMRSDDEISRLSPAARRDRLREWAGE